MRLLLLLSGLRAIDSTVRAGLLHLTLLMHLLLLMQKLLLLLPHTRLLLEGEDKLLCLDVFGIRVRYTTLSHLFEFLDDVSIIHQQLGARPSMERKAIEKKNG